ncbi:glycosyltransferase family 2 protein [Ornithinimicrobium sp. Y1847]|uniref:glycosyltransferase family 2 protein n=1 Tax=Ornithinimicrobium sp. Y1847 TaxID=3405419 RepID=UPI003B6777BF
MVPQEPSAAPEVSVIIIVRNGAATIAGQLDALGGQQGAPEFEVIVVDNGSSDGTGKIVETWITGGHPAASSARLIDAGQAKGIPAVRNIGARAARGRVLAWCDSDDAVRPGWVAAMARLQAGLAGGRTLAWRPDGSADHGAFPDGLTATEYLPHAGNCNMAVVRDHFFEVGAYDESLPLYGCEDVDISWRIQEAGYPVHYFPEAVVDFRITARSRVIVKTFRSAKARMAVVLRHPASQLGRPPTLAAVLRDAGQQTLWLPYRLARPRPAPRSRWLRGWVASWGRLTGFAVYGIRRVPAKYGSEEDPLAPLR